MKSCRRMIFMATLTVAAGGCNFFGSDNNNGSRPPPPPPVAQTYTVTVTSVGIANQDSGEILFVDGVPVQGAVLTIE